MRPPVQAQQAAAYNLETQYRQIVLAAEDNRLRIPDWLRTPVLDQHRLRMTEDIRLLIKLAYNEKLPEAQRLAVRALGRYESREFITDLLPLVATVPEAADAIVRAFHGPVHPADRSGEQMQRFVDTVTSLATRDDLYAGLAARVLGDLSYDRPAVAASGLAHLKNLLKRAETNPRFPIPAIVRAIETYVRKSSKLAPIGEDLLERLRFIATTKNVRYQAALAPATSALVLAGGMDYDTLRITAADGLNPYRRYLSAIAVGRSATAMDDAERIALLRKLLVDTETSVRIEAVRSWAGMAATSEGCEPLLEMLDDRNTRLVTVIFDLLGDACPDSERVTDALTAYGGRTPPTDGAWHRAVHAFVSLARRSPDRVAVLLKSSYLPHPTWQVRMYAARVATMLKDAVALERLAVDPEDNVREAALSGLRVLKSSESDPIFVAALGRSDYQLLRRAAMELKGAEPTAELANALLNALMRVTAEKKETSRDTRLAIIERLAELGYPDQAERLSPLLRDFDIDVGIAAANLMQKWTGRVQDLQPLPLPRPALPSDGELAEDVDAVIEMDDGRKFGIRLDIDVAPLTVTRFKRLVRANYYDRLTFHRVVPNFVIQGGSPGANEYAGDAQFMRDELGRSNAAYTVGLSTRGRDTGDAQFYINLVDNTRLDDDYTVFGSVCGGREVVDAILEGARIRSIGLEKYDPCRPDERGGR